MNQYRHGDLLIIQVSEIPADAKLSKKDKDKVLAYGEVTGHAHRLGEGTTVLELNSTTYFKAERETTLTHEEHGPITFQPGSYKVIHQREYSPERGSINVRD